MMKVIFAVIAVFAIYASAQKEASNEFLLQFKSLKHLISSAGKVKDIQKMLSWKNRKSCLPDDMAMLPQRLLDWFHVLKSQKKPNEGVYDKELSDLVSKNAGCSSTALIWFFKEFDSNKDMLLDVDELKEIETIPYEHCLKQFFHQCDVNKDQRLSLQETCGCFSVEPPCFEALKKYKHMLGEYKPKCDEDGFFEARQCFEEFCWCVNRFNQPIEGTRAKGLVECHDNTDPNEVLFTGEEGEEEEEMEEEEEKQHTD